MLSRTTLCVAAVPLLALISICDEKFHSLHRKQGSFSSHGYPAFYPPEVTCRYIFQGQGRERVQIAFIDLDLRVSEEDQVGGQAAQTCDASDSVTVSVSVGGASEDIGVYCGSRRPLTLMSHDSQLNVTLTSGMHPRGRGFLANYSFVTDFGIKVGEHDVNMVCGFVFRSERVSNGSFTSPNFPGLYPRNTECHYLFYGAQHEYIYITFPYFDVEGVLPGCQESTHSDYVEFSNFNVELMDRKMSRFCGIKNDDSRGGASGGGGGSARKDVYSDGNFFRVTFKSNNVYDATGFEAFYQFRKVEDPFSHTSRVSSGAARSIVSCTLHCLALTFAAVAILFPVALCTLL